MNGSGRRCSALFSQLMGRKAAVISDDPDPETVSKVMAFLTRKRDPFLHFYETFLAAYNPAKRKARGVWYTPEPVVNFIVRAVDEVLQTEFGLQDGLADTSKITIDWDTGQTKNAKAVTIKKEVHRVQILDPATGTGTFLAEVIKQIAPKIKDVAEGMWSPYIEKDLIPRLHGFELLMASYAMCHMKLDMILTEMGYKTYAELLKIDFPRIPWPISPDEFWDISTRGAELRKLHLMEPAAVGPTPYPFKGEGGAVVEKPRFEDGKVWINDTQYFDAAPEVSWGFYIGGYQPAQKWLKDRRGRALTFEDVKHYQRVLKILSETDRVMKSITMNLT